MRPTLAAVALALAAASAHGQTPLTWERVGTVENVRGLGFDGATAYAVPFDPIQVLRPGAPDWADAFGGARGSDLWIAPDRTIFVRDGAPNGLFLSHDGGATWPDGSDVAWTLPILTPGGAFLAGTRGQATGHLAVRSTDGGVTWAAVGFPSASGYGIGAMSFAVLPPSPVLPGGRIVAVGAGGTAYSDDDGRTWKRGSIYDGSGTVGGAWSVVRVPTGPHAGRLVAIVEFTDEVWGFYGSTDGESWTRLGPFPDTFFVYMTRLLADRDGTLYYYTVEDEDRPIYRSRDGGDTWESAGIVQGVWPMELRDLEVGPDGRLWAAAWGRWLGPGEPRGGVYRTTTPVTAPEPGPNEAGAGIRLEVGPNPARGAAAVTVVLDRPAHVRLVVFDALGREAARLHEGALGPGAHAFALDTAALRPGAYVAQVVTGGGARATTRLIVVR